MSDCPWRLFSLKLVLAWSVWTLMQDKVAAINRGESYILDVASERVKALVDAGKLSASTDYAVLGR
jgi:UDP-N-acetyl-D-mannosaminuronate dehydrogenase